MSKPPIFNSIIRLDPVGQISGAEADIDQLETDVSNINSTLTGKVDIDSDVVGSTVIGKFRIESTAGDGVQIGHIDRATSIATCAISQAENGTTQLNSRGGKNLNFSIGNSIKVRVDLAGTLVLQDSAQFPPLKIPLRSAAPTTPGGVGAVYLDDGTNTVSTNPGLRAWTGSVWVDL